MDYSENQAQTRHPDSPQAKREEPQNVTAAPTITRSRFWLILLAICTALFLSALELTAVSTALPTIVESLNGFPSTDFIWVGSAYSLAATAFLPLAGAFAQVFGRRTSMLVTLGLFATGSILCGAAKAEPMFLVGRTIQGIGGGCIISLTNLILADLVPLRERGKYNAVIGLTWSIASLLGPVVGGGLAARGAWRWLFYMNVPLCALVAGLIFRYLIQNQPNAKFEAKVKRLDFIGNLIIVGSTTSCVLALTWGGTKYQWASPMVLAPLCVGIVGMAVFLWYEHVYAIEPTVPLFLLGNRTSLSGYIQTFLIQAILLYYLPVYFQACKLASPVSSGVNMFGLALSLAPVSVVAGFSVAVFRCYRPQLWIGWALVVIAMGLLSLLDENQNIWVSIGYCIFVGAAVGIAYTATMFPILAPLPVSANAHAISLAMFLRVFGQVWGITVGGAILQNSLRGRIPEGVLQAIPQLKGVDITYEVITRIHDFPPETQQEIAAVFSNALTLLWRVMAGIAGAGFVASLFMVDVPMHTHTDETWAIDEKVNPLASPEHPNDHIEN